jgi:hypothetical protein
MSRIRNTENNAYEKKVYSDFELNIDVITAEINDYLQNKGGCPVILSGLGPM